MLQQNKEFQITTFSTFRHVTFTNICLLDDFSFYNVDKEKILTANC